MAVDGDMGTKLAEIWFIDGTTSRKSSSALLLVNKSGTVSVFYNEIADFFIESKKWYNYRFVFECKTNTVTLYINDEEIYSDTFTPTGSDGVTIDNFQGISAIRIGQHVWERLETYEESCLYNNKHMYIDNLSAGVYRGGSEYSGYTEGFGLANEHIYSEYVENTAVNIPEGLTAQNAGNWYDIEGRELEAKIVDKDGNIITDASEDINGKYLYITERAPYERIYSLSGYELYYSEDFSDTEINSENFNLPSDLIWGRGGIGEYSEIDYKNSCLSMQSSNINTRSSAYRTDLQLITSGIENYDSSKPLSLKFLLKLDKITVTTSEIIIYDGNAADVVLRFEPYGAIRNSAGVIIGQWKDGDTIQTEMTILPDYDLCMIWFNGDYAGTSVCNADNVTRVKFRQETPEKLLNVSSAVMEISSLSVFGGVKNRMESGRYVMPSDSRKSICFVYEDENEEGSYIVKAILNLGNTAYRNNVHIKNALTCVCEYYADIPVKLTGFGYDSEEFYSGGTIMETDYSTDGGSMVKTFFWGDEQVMLPVADSELTDLPEWEE